MKNLGQKIRIFLRRIVDFEIKILLCLTYFLIFTPISIVVKFFCDCLDIKKPPSYKSRDEIKDLENFLRTQ
jgi:hypothetical protein